MDLAPAPPKPCWMCKGLGGGWDKRGKWFCGACEGKGSL